MFKVGQTVYTVAYGEGKVHSLSVGNYPVIVQFDGSAVSFDQDGKEIKGQERTLFFKPIPIPEDAMIPPFVPEFVKGDIVRIQQKTEYCDMDEIRVVDEETKNSIYFTETGRVKGSIISTTKVGKTFTKVGHVDI